MNQFTREYIERLPEELRHWAREIGNQNPNPIYFVPHSTTTDEARAIRSAIEELRQFDEQPEMVLESIATI